MTALTHVKLIDRQHCRTISLRVETEFPMTIEARRAVFEAARGKALSLGLKFEDDPEFLAAVEQWTKSAIDMRELRLRYMILLYQRQDSKWLGLPLKSISTLTVDDDNLVASLDPRTTTGDIVNKQKENARQGEDLLGTGSNQCGEEISLAEEESVSV